MQIETAQFGKGSHSALVAKFEALDPDMKEHYAVLSQQSAGLARANRESRKLQHEEQHVVALRCVCSRGCLGSIAYAFCFVAMDFRAGRALATRLLRRTSSTFATDVLDTLADWTCVVPIVASWT